MKTKSIFSLIEIVGKDVFTNSLIVASGCDNRTHESTIKLIRKYQSDFEEFGTLGFKIQKSGGKETTYALLNEDQATLLITYFKNTPTVRRFKIKLVKEFRAALIEIQRLREQRLTIDWQEARANGKCVRSTLGKAIDALSKIADKQGGLKDRKYYSSVTKMVYKALFGDSSLKSVRDKLDFLQLTFLSICEEACADEIERLVQIEADYHLIYAECKKRVIATVEGLSASKLASPNTNIKLVWDKGAE